MTRLRGRAPVGKRARRLIESRGDTLEFLPPCSPDLNSIKVVFAKVKHLLRSLTRRTRDDLWSAMQSALDAVTATHAANWFRYCGYSLRKE